MNEKKNLELPKEGDVVVVTGKIDEHMKARNEHPYIGTCWIAEKGVCSVILTGGDIWWGKLSEVFLYEVEPPRGLEPPQN